MHCALLQHFPLTHQPVKEYGDYTGKAYGEVESPGFVVRQAAGEIHTQERGYQSWYHEYNRDYCQAMDDYIQVVGNDAGVGIHGAVQDVGVHIGHGQCLGIVDDDVLKQISQVFISIDVEEVGAFHFHFEQLVGIQ